MAEPPLSLRKELPGRRQTKKALCPQPSAGLVASDERTNSESQAVKHRLPCPQSLCGWGSLRKAQETDGHH